MVVSLIASALLLDFFGCMMPLALVEDTKAFKVGVFLIWAALVADSVLMGLFYPRELAGVNPLLAAGLESICLICAMYPLHGFASNLAPCGIRVDFVAYRPHRPRDRSSNHATAAELESGTFTFVEVKSCMDDFTSGHGRTFEGDENWLVCPLELADSLASKGMLPKGAAVYSPDARGALRKRYDTSEFRQVRVAPAIELIWAMLRRKSSCETGAGFPV